MNEMTTMNQGTAVAAPGSYDPYAAYGQEASNGGTFLKFSRNGEWVAGQNEDEIALGRCFAASMEDLSIGWIRWADGKPAERLMDLLISGQKPARREELGHLDQELWELDEEGRPKDPWKFTNELPLADPEDGTQYTFSASSKGGIGAIGNLCKAYARERASRAGQVPVLELGRGSYMHPKYKKTYVPVLTISDWVANGSVPMPAVDGGDEEEGPATAEAAAKPKTKF